ncbi:MAG: penicillin-binding protein 2 [Rickettsiaceae bacterium]|nr:penicillin-binding protein 2 [Rickettsiaceae bacterium]
MSLINFSKLFHWQKDSKSTRLRISSIIAFFLVIYFILTTKMFMLALKASQDNKSFLKSVGHRLDIRDRNGELLATNIPSVSLFANPQEIIDPKSTIQKLSTLISLDKNKLKELESDKSFVWLKHSLNPYQRQLINNLGIPGLYFEEHPKRFYVHGNLFSHVLGYVNMDNKGLAGIEKGLEKQISRDINQQKAQKTYDQDSINLSIDLFVQSIASEELEAAITKFNALAGVVVVADANNGEIIAAVSKPDFDPAAPGKAKDDQLFNRLNIGVFELGSIIKTLVLPVAFDTKNITLSDLYDLDNNIKISKYTIKDYHKRSGWNSVPEIFMHSSNIGLANIVLETGKQNIYDYWSALGLFKPVQTELAEKAYPIYPSLKNCTNLNLITMSYGYSMAITPLHFIQAVIPVVNGGYYFPLTFLKKPNNASNEGKQIFNAETSIIMNKLLRLTITEGNSKKAAVKGQLVEGKTGTAEKLVGKKYSKNNRISSFIAAFPAIDPKYVIFVMLDDPRGIKENFGLATAGFTAAPLAAKIIERMAALYGMASYDENDESIKQALEIDYKFNKKNNSGH